MNNSRNKFIAFLTVFLVLFTTFAYSALSTSLTITSNARFKVMANVRVDDIGLQSTNNSLISYDSEYTKNTISSGFKLTSTSSSIDYNVVISNTGNIDQVIYQINTISSNNDGIIIYIDDEPMNDKLPYKIPIGNTTIKITYKTTSPSNQTINIVNQFDFRKLYTVDYNTKGGSQIASQDKIENVDLTLTNSTPTKVGYTFAGWTDEENGTTAKYQAGSKYTLNESVILYAIYSKVTYNITYTLNGGTNNSSNPSTYNVETNDITLKDASKTGWTFTGWTGNGTNTPTKNLKLTKGSTGNKTFVAHFEKTITLTQKHGGTTTTTQTYNLKDSETEHTFKLQNTTNSYPGWTFIGWLDDPTPKVQDYAPTGNITISNDKTVYATYKKELTTTFVDYTGITKQTRTVKGTAYGNNECGGVGNQYSTVKSLTVSNYTDWTKLGWTDSTSENANVSLNSNTDFVLNSDKIYYALYSQDVLLTYDANGGSTKPNDETKQRKVNSYSNVTFSNPTFTLKNTATKTGYTLSKWTISAPISADKNPTDSITIETGNQVTATAKWTANTYTVAYTMNGAAAKANQTVSYDSNLTLTKPTKTFTVNIDANSQGASIKNASGTAVTSASSNQTFAGWTSTVGSNAKTGTTTSNYVTWDGTSTTNTYFKNLTDTNNGTVTLTANWTAVNVTLPNITKTGYTCGYATSAGGNIAYQTGGSYTPSTTTGSVTLFAKCNANQYTVTYNGNGNTGGSTTSSSHTYDEAKTLTKNGFTKTGYTFAGWNTKVDGSGTNYEDEESVTNLVASGNFNLYAQWAPNTNTAYTVYHYIKDLGANTYTLNNTENKTGTSDANLTLTSLKKTITGFTYSKGSLTGSTSGPGTIVTETTIAADGSTKIYLFYTRDTHTVTLTKGTGINTVTGAGTYEYGASVTINNTLNAGYEFVNWTVGTTSTAFATSQSKTFTMGTSDVTYKANGQLINYSITYNLNGGSVSPTNPTSYNVTTNTFTLNNPIKTGYTFTGWTGSNGTNAQTTVSITKGSTGNKTYIANYTAKTYTLNLKPNGGKYNDSTSDASKTMTYDSTNNNSIGTASKTGYTFTGWWTASSGGTQVYNANGQNVNHSTYWTAAYNTGTWKYDGAVTLYAQFTKNDYSIAFNSNAPTGETAAGSMSNLAMKYDEAKNLTSNGYNIAGYTFAGWNTKADGTGTAYLDGASVSNLATTGTVTLYAQWTVNTVTIGLQKDGSSYSNSGIKVTLYDGTTETSFTGTISSGSTVTFSKVPAKTYNIYVGKDTNHKTTMIDSNVDVVVNSSSTSQTVKFYTLTIGLSNTTTTVNGTSISNNGTVVVVEGYAHAVVAAANTGYEFVNNSVIWTNTGTMTIANTKAASTSVVLSSAGKLTATSTAKTFTVTANANNGSITSTTGWTGTGASATKSVTYNSSYGTLPSVSRTGYTFAGWFNNYVNNIEMTAKSSNYNYTIVATFLKPGTTYTIKIDSAEVTAGTATQFTTLLYDFTGSKEIQKIKNNFGNNLEYSVTIPTNIDPSHDIRIYIYSGLQGSTANIGTKYTNVTVSTNGGNSYTSSSTVLTPSNHDIYALWTANTYSVKFNANGGSGTMSNESFTYDSTKALTSNAFTRTGYTFTGWNTKADGTGTSYTNGQSVSNLSSTNGATINLYAQWVENTYSLTFNGVYDTFQVKILSSTGTLKQTVNITSSSKTISNIAYTDIITTTTLGVSKAIDGTSFTTIAASNNPTRTGYTLGNYTMGAENTNAYRSNGSRWYTDFNGSTSCKSFSRMATTQGYNATLTLTWTPNTYSVKFNANGGTGTMSNESFTYDTPKALTTNAFTKTGYTFAGWSTSLSDTNLIYDMNEYSYDNTSGSSYANVKVYNIDPPFAADEVYQLEVDAKGTGRLSNFFHGGTNYLRVASVTDATGTTYTTGFTDGYNNIPITSTYKHFSIRFTLGSTGDGNVVKKVLFRAQPGCNATFKNIKFYKVSASSTAYVDGQSVSNLSSTNGATVNLYAMWLANELTFGNQTITKTFSKSSQTANVTAATNGTGSYTYSKVSGESDITVSSAGVITIPASKTVNTTGYTVVIRATDSNSGMTKDATYTIKINKKKGTVTLTDSTKALTYGTNGTNAYTYDGDGTVSCSSSDTTYVTCSVDTTNKKITVTPVKPTSSAVTITVSAGAGTNYSAADNKTFTVTVGKGTLTVTATPINAAYTGSAQYAKIKVTKSNWDGKTIVSGTSTSYGTTVTSAGAYNTNYDLKPGYTNVQASTTIYYKITGGTYYNDLTGSTTIAITQTTTTTSLSAITKTYNGSAQAASGATAKLANNTAISNAAFTYTYYNGESCSGTALTSAPVAAGTYSVKATLTGTTNYATSTSSCAKYTMNKRDITVTAASSSRAWNGSALTNNTCSGDNLVSGHTVACTMTSGSTITNAGSVDNVISTYSIKSGTTDLTSNYNVTTAKGTLTVTVATPTVTLTAKTEAQRTYTGSAIAANDPTVSPNSSPTITKKYYTNSTCTTGETTTAPTNYGTYYAKAYAAAVTNKTAAASSACVNHSILKAAATNTIKITGTNTWGSTLTATITTNSNGTKSYKWYYSSTAGATSGGTAVGATNCNTGSTCVIPQSLVGKYIYVVGSVGAGTNWNAATDSVDATDATTNTTQAVAKKTCPAPTNVAISTDKKVSWTNASGASSYQISMSSDSGFAAHTNGAAYNSITDATGTRTVYVRSVCDTTYFAAANSANASKSTTVYSVTLTAGTGISSVSGAGNYITGASASIDATVKTGYTWSNWTGSSTITTKSTSVTVNDNKSYTANTTINSYILTVNPNGGSFNGSTTNTTYTQNYDTLKVLPMPTRTGYTFAGWTKTGNGTVTKYGVPKFNEPLSMSVYNNSHNGTVTHTLVSSSEDSPVLNSTNMLKITTSGTASPGLGGFVQSTISYENAVFYHVIVAKIPVGYTINDYKNATGTERKVTWLTSQAGTGKFEVYIYKHQCGSTGTFSSFGYVAINGTAATSENPVTWYVAYANVFDATTSLPEDATQVYTYGVGNTTLTANWVANELVFDNQTITKTFSTSSQTANVTAATNGTGTYTYSKVSGESDITVTSAGVITIPASKAANTTGYSVVVRATDSNSGKTKDATYVIKINKAANPLSVTASQTWSEAFSTSAKDKAITSSNGVGTLSYTIQSQKNTSGTTVNNFSISGSNLRRAASTPVSGSNYTVVVRVTAAGNDNYNSGYKDITYTVTVSKAACLMTLTNASMYTGTALDLTTKTSNAVGGVSYAIKTNGTTTASTLSGTNNKTLTAGAMSDANDTAQSVVITATEAASDNYNTCSKDMTVTVNKNANTLAANNKTVYINSANNYSDIIKTNNGGALTASVTSDGTTGGSNNTTNKKYTAGVLSASNDNNGSVVLSVTSARTTTVAEKTVSVTLTVQKYTNALSFVSPTPAANAALAYNTSYTAKAQAETNGGTNGAITYASGTTSAMTINSTSGAITIAKADGTTSVITASMARTTTVKAASITRTFSTTKGTCPAPTSLAISNAGIVTWTNASGASSYEISINNTSFTAATSGVNYKSTITGATGTRTVYVRSVCDTTYFAAANSANASKSVAVYSVTLTKGTGIKTVSGAGNYITGATVTLGATADTGYSWSKWTQTTGGADVSTTNAYSFTLGTSNITYTANATANPYTVTAKANSGSISATTGWTGTGTSATKSVTYKGTYGTLPSVSKTGYTLAGWNTKDDGTGTTITSSTTMNTASAHDIYAIWVPSEISLADKTLNAGTYGTAYTSNAFDAATNGTGTYTYTLSNAPTGATINSTNRTISFTASTAAGTYNVTVTATDNETSKTDTATMTIVINKRDVTLTAGSSSRAWTGSALTNSTCTGDNLVSGHTVTCTMTSGSTITVASTTANTSASVNNTISTYVIKSGTTDLTSNYNVTTATGTLTISYATPTVTLTAKTDAQRTYTGSAIAANNATVSPNSSPTITKKYYTNSTCTTGETTTAPTNAGTYYAKAYAAAVSTKTNAASSACVNHSIIKAAATNSVAISGTNTWGSTLTATITTNSDGAKSYKWYYSSTAGATSGGTAVGDTNCNTGSTCVIPKSLIGKYIYVVGSVGAGTNWNAATDSVDATDATTNTTQAVDKKTLSVTRTNYSAQYDASAHGVTVKVTNSDWDGKTIVSGTSTSYGTTVTSNGAYNTDYTLSPTYTDYAASARTVYYKVTGGTYYKDYTGSGTVTISKKTATNTIKITGTNTWGSTLTATITTNSNGTKSYKWYYSSTAGATSGGTAVGATNCNTGSTCVIPQSLVGKYIYVVGSVGASTNYTTPADSVDATDATANTTQAVAKKTGTNSIAITGTNTWGSTLTATITTNSDGAKSYKWYYSSTAGATSGGTAVGATNCNTGSTCVIPNTLVGKYIYVVGSVGTSTYYTTPSDSVDATDATANTTQAVAKKTCPAPTNVAIATDKKVSWTNASGASSYQISMSSSSGFAAHTNGAAYNSITDATGTRTVYVRSVCDTTYFTAANSANASKSTTVYSVTLTAGTGISYVSGAGNYITGASASINATVKTGYTWTNWTGSSTISTKSTSVTVNDNKSYTANATPNTYTIAYTMNGGTNASGNPTSGTYDTDAIISNPASKTFTVNIDANSQGATIKNASGTAVTSATATQTFAGWTSSTVGSNAKTGTTANPTTAWSGTSTKNTYFKNLRESGTVTMVANWNAANATLPNITKSGYLCGYSTTASGNIEYYSGDSYATNTTTNSAIIYAKCIQYDYTIQYNMYYGGELPSSHPEGGFTNQDVYITNPTKTVTINFDNAQGATIKNSSNQTITSMTSSQTFKGWTSSSYQSNAKTGTTANPTTSWNGSLTKNTYFKDLRDSGTVTMTANWNSSSITLPNATLSGRNCGYAYYPAGYIIYSNGQSYSVDGEIKSGRLYVRCLMAENLTYNTTNLATSMLPYEYENNVIISQIDGDAQYALDVIADLLK